MNHHNLSLTKESLVSQTHKMCTGSHNVETQLSTQLNHMRKWYSEMVLTNQTREKTEN